ncbi:MAG: hypothetical protein EB127_02005 [Alphaproteobacteria bacterium]|nr:hypothetical protein [Alphaproteobacteria bacterium]
MPRKVSKKHNKRTRKVKRGGYYGYAGDLGVAGAANWARGSEMGDFSISNRGGNGMYQYGRGRKHKKSRKTMRGGTAYGLASAGLTGRGAERGLGGFEDVGGYPGSAKEGAFNNFGAQPGSGYKSFITAGSK